MKTTTLSIAAILISASAHFGGANAQAQCDDGYTLCMSGCATDRAAERCMQRCREAERRCSKSGVFRMPVGFLLNRSRVEEMSSAQGELPQIGIKSRAGKKTGESGSL